MNSQQILIALCWTVLWLGQGAWANEPDAPQQWLQRMPKAVQQMNYKGVFLHDRQGKVGVYAIYHAYQQSIERELLRKMDGVVLEVYREGLQQTCYLPKGAMAQWDHIIPSVPFSQLSVWNSQQIQRAYRLTQIGWGRMADHQAMIIDIQALDHGRYSYRLWLERDTAMLLQQSVLDAQQRVVEQFRFSDIDLSYQPQPQDFLPRHHDGDHWQQRLLVQAPKRTSPLQWSLAWVPAHFQLSNDMPAKPNTQGAEGRVYSDGLASFSVFKVMQPEQPMAQGRSQMGATSVIVKNLHGHQFVAIGDLPLQTVQRIIDHVVMQPDSGETQ